jgi:hypothetical protein
VEDADCGGSLDCDCDCRVQVAHGVDVDRGVDHGGTNVLDPVGREVSASYVGAVGMHRCTAGEVVAAVAEQQVREAYGVGACRIHERLRTTASCQ